MKIKSLKYFILLILLPLAIYVILKTINPSYSRSTKDFSVKNTSKIETIEISEDSTSILLSRSEDTWILNNKLKANLDNCGLLLVLMERVETRGIASAKKSMTLDSLYKLYGRQMTITGKGQRTKKYEVIGDSAHTFFRKPKVKKWYSVSVPGMPIPMHKLIKADNNLYIDKTLFPLLNAGFEEIKYQHTKKENKYEISRERQGITLKLNDNITNYSQAHMQAFIYRISQLRFSYIENNMSPMDSNFIEELIIKSQSNIDTIRSYNYKNNDSIDSRYVLLLKNNSERIIIKSIEWDAISIGFGLLLPKN